MNKKLGKSKHVNGISLGPFKHTYVVSSQIWICQAYACYDSLHATVSWKSPAIYSQLLSCLHSRKSRFDLGYFDIMRKFRVRKNFFFQIATLTRAFQCKFIINKNYKNSINCAAEDKFEYLFEILFFSRPLSLA